MSTKNSTREISKDEFKKIYFKYGTESNGWSKSYWEQFFENKIVEKYEVTGDPDDDNLSMMISTGQDECRIMLMKDEAIDRFFETPTLGMRLDIWERAEDLVKSKITGHRKGLPDVPAYEHSIRVGVLLRKQDGWVSNLALAALLHDIVEDGGVSLEELKKRGFNDEIVNLVDLCSHDTNIEDSNARWVNMVARLANEGNKDTWAIKLADIYDNLQESHMLNPERRRFMVETKTPLLLALTKDKLGETELWKNLQERAEKLREQDQAIASDGNAGYSHEEIVKIIEIAESFWKNVNPENTPTLALYTGGVGSGKTTVRRQECGTGFVNLDIGEIHAAMKKTFGEDNPKLMAYSILAADLILKSSLKEKKNLAIEIIGNDADEILTLLDKMKEIGYETSIRYVDCDPAEAYSRHLKAVEEDEDYMSSYFTQGDLIKLFDEQFSVQSAG